MDDLTRQVNYKTYEKSNLTYISDKL